MPTVALFLMNQKGLAVLQALLNDFGSSRVEMVVTAKDESVESDFCREIQELCQQSGIAVYDRKSYPTVSSTYSFSIGWRWLLRDLRKLIIFHDSLLPRYRGFNPLVSYLLNKENEVGVTALFAQEHFDTGDIISQESTRISHPMRIQKAIELIAPLYCQLAVSLMKRIVEGAELNSTPQNSALATYSLWRDEQDYSIDWKRDAEYIQRFIYAVGNPYKGAATQINGTAARVHDADILDDLIFENRVPGKVFRIDQGCPIVVCGKGLLKITVISSDESGESLLPMQRIRTRFA
jgi:methionyl-tRNA formyltransferase